MRQFLYGWWIHIGYIHIHIMICDMIYDMEMAWDPYQCGIGYIHDGDGGLCLSTQGLSHT